MWRRESHSRVGEYVGTLRVEGPRAGLLRLGVARLARPRDGRRLQPRLGAREGGPGITGGPAWATGRGRGGCVWCGAVPRGGTPAVAAIAARTRQAQHRRPGGEGSERACEIAQTLTACSGTKSTLVFSATPSTCAQTAERPQATATRQLRLREQDPMYDEPYLAREQSASFSIGGPPLKIPADEKPSRCAPNAAPTTAALMST